MFQDEGRFGRISEVRRCWAPPGVRPEVGAQIVRQYTHVFAAVSPADGVMDSLILPYADTEAMLLFLNEVAARHADEFVLMYMDQAGWHKSAAKRVPSNMRLEWLPPYSPQLNPSEHIWDEVREKWFVNLVFDQMRGVEKTLIVALRTLESDHERVQKLTGFDWIISSLLNAT